MRLFAFLLAPHNLPFVAALGSCLVLALLQVMGGLGDHDAHADGHVDLHADGHVDLHVDGHVDVHADAGAHHGAHEAGEGVLGGALSALGVGRVPIMLVLMIFLGSFGAVGLLANTLLASALRAYSAPTLLGVLIAAGVIAAVATGRISGLFARLAPNSSTAVGFEQLVGRVGVVVSPTISSSYGRVQVKDSFGSLHTVYAVVDSDEPLPEHAEVALVAYDAAQRRFFVRGIDDARRRAAGRERQMKNEK